MTVAIPFSTRAARKALGRVRVDVGMPPHARALREDLERRRADLAGADRGLVGAARRAEVRSEVHRPMVSGRLGPHRRRRLDWAAVSRSRRPHAAQPDRARSTSGPCARCSSTGCTPATRAAGSSCGSRTPIGRGRPRRRSPRPRTCSAGSGSTGTRARTGRRSGSTSTRRRPRTWSKSGAAYRVLLHRRGARRRAGAAPGRRAARSSTRADAAASPPRSGRPARRPASPVVRLAMPDGGDDRHRGRRPRSRRVGQRAPGRPRHLPLRRHADLPLRQPVRRHPHGHHARDPRRGPAAVDAAPARGLRRARGRAADLRAPADGARHRQEEALEAPRRRLGRGVPRPRHPRRRRSSTTWRSSAGATTTTRP